MLDLTALFIGLIVCCDSAALLNLLLSLYASDTERFDCYQILYFTFFVSIKVVLKLIFHRTLKIQLMG